MHQASNLSLQDGTEKVSSGETPQMSPVGGSTGHLCVLRQESLSHPRAPIALSKMPKAL